MKFVEKNLYVRRTDAFVHIDTMQGQHATEFVKALRSVTEEVFEIGLSLFQGQRTGGAYEWRPVGSVFPQDFLLHSRRGSIQ
jgi:hypothetical protein